MASARLKVKQYLKNMPDKVQTGPKQFCEILYADKIRGDDGTLGEARPDTRQIVISTNQSDKEKLMTAFHEYIHFLSFDYNINLTENQVLALEKAMPYLIKFILQLEQPTPKKGKKTNAN